MNGSRSPRHFPIIPCVARRRSFAAAAVELGMSPSAISHAVRGVEDPTGNAAVCALSILRLGRRQGVLVVSHASQLGQRRRLSLDTNNVFG